MNELLLLTLPLAVFGYSVLATIALDRQYRRAERWKRKYKQLKDDYAIPDVGHGTVTMTHIEKTVANGVDVVPARQRKEVYR